MEKNNQKDRVKMNKQLIKIISIKQCLDIDNHDCSNSGNDNTSF